MKKNPGRKQRRQFQKMTTTKGYGSQDKDFCKKVKARRKSGKGPSGKPSKEKE